MINRRGFLGTLMASIVGTAFVPDKLLWMPISDGDLPSVAPSALLTLDAITAEMARLLSQSVRLPIVREPRGLKLGQRGMIQQFNTTMPVPKELHETGLDSDRYVKPMAAALAHRIHTMTGMLAMGELPVEHHLACDVCRVTRDGVSVRGVMAYTLDWDDYFLRFDVIGGRAA